MIKMIIKKGTTVCPSKIGHNNFHYPDVSKEYVTSMDIEVSRLYWALRDDKTPVEVISPVDYLPYKVLWIELPV